MFLPLLLSRGPWRDLAHSCRAALGLRTHDVRRDELSLPIRVSDRAGRR